MKIGITGHQERKGIEWPWVKDIICAELRSIEKVDKVMSSLAAGSDQVFADAAISLGIPVIAVIPLEKYDEFFKGPSLAVYLELISKCELMQLAWEGDPERAFFEAGKFIVGACDMLFAVWDGAEAEGLGGTADVVAYAMQIHRSVIHINPIDKSVRRI